MIPYQTQGNTVLMVARSWEDGVAVVCIAVTEEMAKTIAEALNYKVAESVIDGDYSKKV